MEYVNELIALGIDSVIFGLCLKEFFDCKRIIKNLRSAPVLPINSDFKNYLSEQNNQKVPYAFIRGTVAPIGIPLRSHKLPAVTSVVQVQKLLEHRVTRGVVGFWSENSKLLHMSTIFIPFELKNGNAGVEIIEPTSAAILDLELINDTYEPTALTVMDHLFGFLSGVRQNGFQLTEEVLREGTLITAVGELHIENDKVCLGPSNVGPMFLTTSTKRGLIKIFEEARHSSIVKIIICGSLASIITALLVQKYRARRKMQLEARLLKEALEKERRLRRTNAPKEKFVKQENMCVICLNNPKEIICLPCGHVCMCEDCSDKTKTKCPVCRADIVNRAAAFIT